MAAAKICRRGKKRSLCGIAIPKYGNNKCMLVIFSRRTLERSGEDGMMQVF